MYCMCEIERNFVLTIKYVNSDGVGMTARWQAGIVAAVVGGGPRHEQRAPRVLRRFLVLQADAAARRAEIEVAAIAIPGNGGRRHRVEGDGAAEADAAARLHENRLLALDHSCRSCKENDSHSYCKLSCIYIVCNSNMNSNLPHLQYMTSNPETKNLLRRILLTYCR